MIHPQTLRTFLPLIYLESSRARSVLDQQMMFKSWIRFVFRMMCGCFMSFVFPLKISNQFAIVVLCAGFGSWSPEDRRKIKSHIISSHSKPQVNVNSICLNVLETFVVVSFRHPIALFNPPPSPAAVHIGVLRKHFGCFDLLRATKTLNLYRSGKVLLRAEI